MRPTVVLAAVVCALAACSDDRTPTEPLDGVRSLPIEAAQTRPTEVDETPFEVPFCGFPVLVVLSGKGKTIEIGGGRTILTAPGLTATMTNLDNGNQETIGITGSVHQTLLENGDVAVVWTGRNALFDPLLPGLFLVIGRFSAVLDAGGNVVEPLQGSGRLVDVCALLA
jgi:hypothetical protein